ncbi:uncharacterized protein LOC116639210 [Phoca vitulina]|uniref:uncharacterized protein LOC116639210 n=1 Tax=Phoca vitulina TaxID=9720 RepID=UPI0013962E7F|nr:uncharacterized protein LOC116639210 [Phoca vitulina]
MAVLLAGRLFIQAVRPPLEGLAREKPRLWPGLAGFPANSRSLRPEAPACRDSRSRRHGGHSGGLNSGPGFRHTRSLGSRSAALGSRRGPDLRSPTGPLLRGSNPFSASPPTAQAPGKVTRWAQRRIINTFRHGPSQHPPLAGPINTHLRLVRSTPISGWSNQHSPQADTLYIDLRLAQSTPTSCRSDQHPPQNNAINTHFRPTGRGLVSYLPSLALPDRRRRT